MDSLTKNRQTPAALLAMIEQAYGPDQVPAGDDWFSEMGDGWFSVAYRIRLRDGAEKVLKISPPADVEVLTYERGAMATEVAAIRLIHEHTTVPVPALDHAHAGKDFSWFFMDFVDGENLGLIRDSLSDEERVAYQKARGAANRELNSIRGTGFGRLDAPGDPSWRTVFTGMVSDVLRDGERRSVDLGRDYDAIRTVLAANAACLDEVTEPRLCEWDLWDGNVLVRDGAIVGIIDHERAFYGDPLIENGFAGCVPSGFADPAPFMEGYGHPPLTEPELRRRRLYNLHFLLILVIETEYRRFPDPGQYNWARAQLADLLPQF
ncbi:phosphotransferase [Actinoplanes sp. NPDC051861]|uniref:phosphotransferase family protein n=1 Tax=Actinoplanes sp. NPDC051861 TaxID=3155170 RepID=UPI003439267A